MFYFPLVADERRDSPTPSTCHSSALTRDLAPPCISARPSTGRSVSKERPARLKCVSERLCTGAPAVHTRMCNLPWMRQCVHCAYTLALSAPLKACGALHLESRETNGKKSYPVSLWGGELDIRCSLIVQYLAPTCALCPRARGWSHITFPARGGL